MMSLAKQVSKPSIGSFKTKNLDPEDLIDILIWYDTALNLDYDLKVLIADYEDVLSRSLLLKILIYYDIWDVTKWVLSRLPSMKKEQVIPETFAYSLIVNKVRYSFLLFENFQ